MNETINFAEIAQVAHVFEQIYPEIKVYYDSSRRVLQTAAYDPFEINLFGDCLEMSMGQVCERTYKVFDSIRFLDNYFSKKQLPHFCHQLIFRRCYFKAITMFY